MNNIVSDSVRVGDTDMYYVAAGTGDRNLVVLPGLSDGIVTVKGKGMLLMHPYKPFFEQFRVYMFSRKNDMPREGYTIKDMADDQALAMQALGIEKACVLGVSQGGMVAQYVAINHPEVVDKLILAVTAPYANSTVTSAVTTWIDMARHNDYKSLMIDTAEKMYTEEYLSKNRRTFPIVAKLTKPKSYERFYVNANAILDFDARSELNKISCPTLIIAGDNDNTVGNDAPQELSAGIADSQVYIYHGYGHGIHEECKDFYERVYEFCK